LCDRPRVASDGNNFLVVWEEMPAGKDWDVYGVIVSSADGKVLTKPFLIAGGKHNQCRPDVAFAKGSYHVLYMAYEDDRYKIHGMRVSSDGKLLTNKPVVIAEVPGKPDNPVNVILPVVSASIEGDLLAGFLVRDIYRLSYAGFRPLDGATGEPEGNSPSGTKAPGTKSPGGKGWGGRERTPALAMGTDGAISVSTTETSRSRNDITIARLSRKGEVLDIEEAGAGKLGISDPFKPIPARFSATSIDNGYIVVGEVLGTGEKKFYARVIGWNIGQDGKVLGEAFAITGEPDRECVLPSVARGPDKSFLVVYSELRGIDNVRIAGRLIKK